MMKAGREAFKCAAASWLSSSQSACACVRACVRGWVGGWVGGCVCACQSESMLPSMLPSADSSIRRKREQVSGWQARPRWSATSLLSPRTRPSMLDYSKVTARSWCSSHVSRSGLNLRRVSHLQQPAPKSVVAYCILLLVAVQIPVFRDHTCTDNSYIIPVLWINKHVCHVLLPVAVICKYSLYEAIMSVRNMHEQASAQEEQYIDR